jgi:hypothetical protein
VCARPTEPSGSFELRTLSSTRKDRLGWKLTDLPDTEVDDFGDPTMSTDVAVCPFYRDEIHGATLLTSFRAPAASTCGTRPCWKRLRTGFKYRDGQAASDGLSSVALKAGTAGSARIIAKGRGPNLPDWPGLPHPPLGVLLRAGARCWVADYLDIVDRPGAIEARDGQ